MILTSVIDAQGRSALTDNEHVFITRLVGLLDHKLFLRIAYGHHALMKKDDVEPEKFLYYTDANSAWVEARLFDRLNLDPEDYADNCAYVDNVFAIAKNCGVLRKALNCPPDIYTDVVEYLMRSIT